MPSPVEEIKSRLSIQEVVGSYVRLAKAGANFKALCPFHNEKTPSFFVSPARESWHCFGCSLGGDMFSFIQQIEGVEFPEALEMLAQRAGVVLKKEDPRLLTERKRALALLEEASRYFERELGEKPEVMDYLRSRGLAPEGITSFRLGWAPLSWEGTVNYLKSRGYRSEEIERAGLAIRREAREGDARRFAEGPSFYDRFRGRIMFPIADGSGRIIGFSGRIFVLSAEASAKAEASATEVEAKYINTPQTIVYNKSRILYLWDRAKNEIRKENACILVEGQMDALLSHQAGVANTVATSGTALGQEHLALIKRLSSKLLLAFDTDEAGEEAARRAVGLALEHGFDVHIIPISQGKDPADMIREDPALWRRAVGEAKPFLVVLLQRLYNKFSDDPLRLRRETSVRILPYVGRVENELEKAHWVQEVSKVLLLREEAVWEELKRISKHESKKKSAGGECNDSQRPAIGKTRRSLLEERIVGLLASRKGEFNEADWEGLEKFFSEENKTLLEHCIAEEKGGNTVLVADEIGARIKKCSLEAELLYPAPLAVRQELQKLSRELEREYLRSHLEKLASEIRGLEARGEAGKLSASLEEFNEVSRELSRSPLKNL